MVFTVVSIMGLFIVALGVTYRCYWVLFIGRGIFGVAAEAQNIWIATIISIWFYYGEISSASA